MSQTVESQTVDPHTGEILDRTTATATGALADLLDSSSFLASLRELDDRIAQADREIGVLKENIKVSRNYREALVAELRATARGDRALPFGEPEPATPPASAPQKGTA